VQSMFITAVRCSNRDCLASFKSVDAEVWNRRATTPTPASQPAPREDWSFQDARIPERLDLSAESADGDEQPSPARSDTPESCDHCGGDLDSNSPCDNCAAGNEVPARSDKDADLSPCPFCGAPAEYEEDWDANYSNRVACTACPAEVSVIKGDFSQWNRRAAKTQESDLSSDTIDTPEFWAVMTDWIGARGTSKSAYLRAKLVEFIDARRATADTTAPETAEKIPCPECKGTGGVQRAGDCSDCNGKGFDWDVAGTTAAPAEYLPTDESSEVIIDFMRGHGCGDAFASYVRTRMMSDFAQELASCLLAERATAGNAAPTEARAITEIKRRLKALIGHGDALQEGYGWALAMVENVEAEFASNTATAALTSSSAKSGAESCETRMDSSSASDVIPAATAAPGDLPPLPWGDDFEAWLEPRRQKDVAEAFREYGRACIASNAGAAIPESFALVPVEPTPAMMDAAEACSNDWPRTTWTAAWAAMLAAAPSNPPAGAKEQTK
jgi:hypothetical protein